jgi:hypothetical protein
MPVLSFQALALLYGIAALFTLWRLVREWRPLLDEVWTPRDVQLAQMVGFLLLTPVTVWLHEWGHAAAMRAFGATDPQIHFFFYWGYVTSPHRFTPGEQFVVSLAGPLVSYVLGIGLLALALVAPLRRAIALAVATCAILELVLILIMYPAMSLLGGWGDFVGIYESGVPGASLVVGIVHAASLVGFVWLMNRVWMRGFMSYPVPRPWRLQWVQTVQQGDAGT